jgi:ATPase subunit of ABC transporter with duplicated ATPase domains
METELAEAADDPSMMEEKLNKLADLQEQANMKGVYSLESRIEKIMDQTGFGEADGDALVSSFSGGWKMRIGIAKILLQEPNVLLLDEPTNHLDLDSVIWLEGFLVKQTIPIIIVSHDREFLDQTCNRIVDVEEGKTVSYKGNYSKFIAQRLDRLNIWREKYDRQTKFVREEEKTLKKMKSDPNMAQQMKNRAAALQKLKDSPDFVSMPPKDKRFRFRFPPAQRCSTNVVEAEGLTHGYGSGKHETLFRDVSFKVERGERIGFVGPNGSGKSTMLRLIMGTEDPKDGYSEYGGSNVFANYFAQNQADSFDLSKTVLQTVSEGAPNDYSLTEIRTLLSQFMFKGDDVEKKLEVLSGGEKARVALCRMMLTPANLLLLDEPTNHLDITSKEVLEDALQYYEGSVMLVSHDRYFMSQAVNTIFEFSDRSMQRHDCDYLDYMLGRGGLKERVESRYVKGDSYRITAAPEVQVEKKERSKKNFGGSGVTGGNLNKGIKNAKRFSN